MGQPAGGNDHDTKGGHKILANFRRNKFVAIKREWSENLVEKQVVYYQIISAIEWQKFTVRNP